MKQRWVVIGQKFNALTERERIMIATALFVVLASVAYLILDDGWMKQQQLQSQLDSLTTDNQLLQLHIEGYQQRLKINPDDEYRKKLADIELQTDSADQKLKQQMVDMIPADDMAQVLSQLLSKVKGLKLIEFNSIAAVPLLKDKDHNKMNLYRHGIRIVFEGDYFSTLRFVESVEQLPSRLYWNKLDYVVDKYPIAKVELELNTLSINKDFISVASKN
ncbi:hypothetical protein [Shewanella marina]|uniref:hypothetical protein n=1 Tax=Shewanella marina TaxID=487319 RepID=UPI0004708684|nr:hypothetical protein [Shewanella marina]